MVYCVLFPKYLIMSERAPKLDLVEQESNIETLANWRELKTEAPAKAQESIQAIDGYAEMELSEQIQALDTLLEELSEDNKNRFVAREVAYDAALLEEEARHQSRLQQIGQPMRANA